MYDLLLYYHILNCSCRTIYCVACRTANMFSFYRLWKRKQNIICVIIICIVFIQVCEMLWEKELQYLTSVFFFGKKKEFKNKHMYMTQEWLKTINFMGNHHNYMQHVEWKEWNGRQPYIIIYKIIFMQLHNYTFECEFIIEKYNHLMPPSYANIDGICHGLWRILVQQLLRQMSDRMPWLCHWHHCS